MYLPHTWRSSTHSKPKLLVHNKGSSRSGGTSSVITPRLYFLRSAAAKPVALTGARPRPPPRGDGGRGCPAPPGGARGGGRRVGPPAPPTRAAQGAGGAPPRGPPPRGGAGARRLAPDPPPARRKNHGMPRS